MIRLPVLLSVVVVEGLVLDFWCGCRGLAAKHAVGPGFLVGNGGEGTWKRVAKKTKTIVAEGLETSSPSTLE